MRQVKAGEAYQDKHHHSNYVRVMCLANEGSAARTVVYRDWEDRWFAHDEDAFLRFYQLLPDVVSIEFVPVAILVETLGELGLKAPSVLHFDGRDVSAIETALAAGLKKRMAVGDETHKLTADDLPISSLETAGTVVFIYKIGTEEQP